LANLIFGARIATEAICFHYQQAIKILKGLSYISQTRLWEDP